MTTVAQIAATGERVDDLFVPYTTDDGVTELYRQTYFPVAGAGGSIESVGLLIEEIGEQEKVRSRLRSFEALVDQADDFIAVASLDNRMLYLNRGGRSLVGQETGDAVLPEAADYLSQSRAAVLKHRSLHGAGGARSTSGTSSPASRSKSMRPCSWSTTPTPTLPSSTPP